MIRTPKELLGVWLGALAGVVLALGVATPAPASDGDFPEPEALKSAVDFWMRVYLESSTDGGFVHDSRHLGVVYERMSFDGEKHRKRRQRAIDARKGHWRSVLRKLAKGGSPAGEREEAVVEMFARELGRAPRASDYSNATRRLRFQLGQRDKFRAGLIRAGAYEDEMRAIFRDANLPEDLAFLPHVESSFNVRAYSKYGAAGAWQFMRSTGRRYMKVDYVVDERLDPIESTYAATKLLRDNYRSLQSWPLAITAYNHGAAGMRRAKRKVGTDRIDVIVKRYKSRTFGFASRNFYAQFLAARRVVLSYESYFGPLERELPRVVDEIELPFYVGVSDIDKHLGVAPSVVRELNPALRPTVFRSGKRIPRGYTLRLPAGTIGTDTEAWLAQLPAGKRYAEQHRSNYHVVRRGDTLGAIARRHRTSVSTLAAINNLPSRHKIYPGQVLQLPGSTPPKARRRGLVRTASAAPVKEPKPDPVVTPVQGGPPAALSPDSVFRRVQDDRVLVDASETLGHYADWLEVSVGRLRRLNGLSTRQTLRLGQELRLDFSRVGADRFLERRLEYHKGIEEDFFGSYKVTGTVEHRLKRGDSLWVIAHKVYSVPEWLIRRYNPELDLTRLTPGTKLRIPVAEKLS